MKKRIISIVLVFVMLFTLLPVTVSAASECKHGRTQKDYYLTEYIAKSYDEHIRLKFYNLVCRSCGEVIDLGYTEKELSHNFEDGSCTKCG